MATLTETASLSRQMIKWGAMALVLILTGRFLGTIIISFYRQLNPPAPKAPTVAFGKLPKIDFSNEEGEIITTANINFQLETIEGGLPAMPLQSKVYFIPLPGPNLLALERAVKLANSLGFSGEGIKVNNLIYQWIDKENDRLTLRIDINLGTFTLNYDFRNDNDIFRPSGLPNKETALAQAEDFFAKASGHKEDLEALTENVIYLKHEGNQLVAITDMSQAEAVRVDFFPKKMDNLAIVAPKFGEGPAYIIFSGSSLPKKRIVKAVYQFLPIDRTTSATYPLHKIEDAFETLKNGQGYVGRRSLVKDKAIIRKVTLAYFYSFRLEKFLQPVYVFEGDQDFKAYVPAISPIWIQE